MKDVLIAAMNKKKGEGGDHKQKDTAKGLQDAMERARKKFLAEHPEAAKRPFGKERPSKEKQEKETKKRRKEIRKDSMSSKNNFSMDYVEEQNYSRFGWYQRKYANFARTVGAKDKKPRKKRRAGAITKGAKYGTLVGLGLGGLGILANPRSKLAWGLLPGIVADKALQGTIIGAITKGVRAVQGKTKEGYI